MARKIFLSILVLGIILLASSYILLSIKSFGIRELIDQTMEIPPLDKKMIYLTPTEGVLEGYVRSNVPINVIIKEEDTGIIWQAEDVKYTRIKCNVYSDIYILEIKNPNLFSYAEVIIYLENHYYYYPYSDFAASLFVLSVILIPVGLVGVVIATILKKRRKRRSEQSPN